MLGLSHQETEMYNGMLLAKTQTEPEKSEWYNHMRGFGLLTSEVMFVLCRLFFL